MLPPHFSSDVGLLGLSVVSHGFTLILGFSPMTQKLGTTAKNGLQIWNQHRKIH